MGGAAQKTSVADMMELELFDADNEAVGSSRCGGKELGGLRRKNSKCPQ
jgi:hypothetical protein